MFQVSLCQPAGSKTGSCSVPGRPLQQTSLSGLPWMLQAGGFCCMCRSGAPVRDFFLAWCAMHAYYSCSPTCRLFVCTVALITAEHEVTCKI